MKIIYTAIILILGLSTYAGSVDAECRGRVQLVGSRSAGSKIFTTWQVRHNAGNIASVYFEYKITFVDADSTDGVVRGTFMEYVPSSGGRYTEEDIVTYPYDTPVSVISVDFDEISCYD